MIRRLFIMRHAKSSWADPGARDFDRPLNARGQHATPLMGDRLRAAGYKVDIILASTAVRVRETLGLLLPAWSESPPVLWEKQLYLASREGLLAQLAALDAEWCNAMIVGHNPGLSELVGHLIEDEVDMPTAAIAILEREAKDWPGALKNRPWRAEAYWTPKD